MHQRPNTEPRGICRRVLAVSLPSLLAVSLAHCGPSTPPPENGHAAACAPGMVPIAARTKADIWAHAALCLDETEVGVTAYTACVESGKCTRPDGDDAACNFGKAEKADHPINCVTRAQAVAYCAYAGKRVPTHGELASVQDDAQEAMFHGRALPWDEICENSSPAVSDPEVKPRRTCPLRSGPRSPQGLYGIVGNVWEWTTTEDMPGDPVHFMMLAGSNARYPMGATFPSENSRPDGNADVDSGVRCAR